MTIANNILYNWDYGIHTTSADSYRAWSPTTSSTWSPPAAR